ncbi:MAG: glycoside hydrolase family 30 protein [Chitinophagaceae bacterium]
MKFILSILAITTVFSVYSQNRYVKTKVVTTAKTTGKYMVTTDTVKWVDYQQPVETDICVFIDNTKQFQTFLGIGGAITDASAETFAKLPPQVQQQFLKAYFNKQEGIGYSLARTTIHSSDFSSGSYTYVNEGDKNLASFSIAHDETYRIPLLKKAIAEAGGKLTLFVSPWSPPAYMKTNGNMLRGGKLKPEYRQLWANYFAKFIKAYEAKGIPIWGLTVQNEPMATQKWESCLYTAQEEADFVEKFLGPTLEKNQLKDKKIIIWDHNRDLIFQRASTTLANKNVAKFVWGIGFHWYETWTGSQPMFDNIKRVKEAFPDKNLLFTEGCKELFSMDRINDWALGEMYGRSLINDFNNGTVGWTDWNILLDEKGGPNHVGNFCFAPIHANTQTGELIFTNAYYYLGHFSKYIQPGAKRISVATNRDYLLATGFMNTNGTTVVVIMNNGDKEAPVNIWQKGKALVINTLPHSIQTIIIDN